MTRKMFNLTIFFLFMFSFFGCSNGQMEGSIEVPIVFGGSSEKSKIPDLYELQERCGKHCEEVFVKKYGDGYKNPPLESFYEYESHYNKKLNKCIMLVKTHTIFKNGNNEWGTEILDINENKLLGRCFTESSCYILDKKCKSEEEWNSLVKPYMTE